MRSPVCLSVLALVVVTGCGGEPSSAPTGFLEGGPQAFEKRLAELEGTPVVVNQWASWCGPCRAEFPYFDNLAQEYKGRVAFLGVNSRDSRDDAARFLAENPVPFPHFFDPDARIARVFRGGRAWPTTAFYRADGSLEFTHQGAYRDESALKDDIERYALDG